MAEEVPAKLWDGDSWGDRIPVELLRAMQRVFAPVISSSVESGQVQAADAPASDEPEQYKW